MRPCVLQVYRRRRSLLQRLSRFSQLQGLEALMIRHLYIRRPGSPSYGGRSYRWQTPSLATVSSTAAALRQRLPWSETRQAARLLGERDEQLSFTSGPLTADDGSRVGAVDCHPLRRTVTGTVRSAASGASAGEDRDREEEETDFTV